MEDWKVLTIDITVPKDRRDMFVRACELLALDKDKEAKRLKISSTGAGLNVKTEQLIKFCFDHKGSIINGSLDIDSKSLKIRCESIPAKGKSIIENPETIKETSVDTSGSNDPLAGFKSTAESDEEEDDLFE